jgi:hypothetical protein
MDVEIFAYLGKKYGFFGFQAENEAFDRNRGRHRHREITGTRFSYREILFSRLEIACC